MNEPPSNFRRLQVLRAIPESQRTEAEWDELNELEIVLAPGNKAIQQQGIVHLTGGTAGAGQKPNAWAHSKRLEKRFHKR